MKIFWTLFGTLLGPTVGDGTFVIVRVRLALALCSALDLKVASSILAHDSFLVRGN